MNILILCFAINEMLINKCQKVPVFLLKRWVITTRRPTWRSFLRILYSSSSLNIWNWHSLLLRLTDLMENEKKRRVINFLHFFLSNFFRKDLFIFDHLMCALRSNIKLLKYRFELQRTHFAILKMLSWSKSSSRGCRIWIS